MVVTELNKVKYETSPLSYYTQQKCGICDNIAIKAIIANVTKQYHPDGTISNERYDIHCLICSEECFNLWLIKHQT